MLTDKEREQMQKEIDEMLDRVLENSAYLIRYFKGQVTREKQEATEPDSPKLDSDADWE